MVDTRYPHLKSNKRNKKDDRQSKLKTKRKTNCPTVKKSREGILSSLSLVKRDVGVESSFLLIFRRRPSRLLKTRDGESIAYSSNNAPLRKKGTKNWKSEPISIITRSAISSSLSSSIQFSSVHYLGHKKEENVLFRSLTQRTSCILPPHLPSNKITHTSILFTKGKWCEEEHTILTPTHANWP